MHPTRPRFLTIREAAQLLRIQPEAVRRRIQKGKLTAIKLPGAKGWLIPESMLKQEINGSVIHADNTTQG
jgi:excisionase family DNA binding protein